MSAEAAKLLRDAAQLIETRGLARFALEDAAGRLCFYGALCVANARDFSFSTNVPSYCLEAVDAIIIRVGKAPHDWSNHSSGAEEVVSVMREVADTLDEPQLIEIEAAERELCEA